MSSPMPTPSPQSDTTAGLSISSVVGITAGTTSGLLALAALAFWLYKKTRKRHLVLASTSVPQMMEHIPGYNKPELSGENSSVGRFNGLLELHTERGPYELSGNAAR